MSLVQEQAGNSENVQQLGLANIVIRLLIGGIAFVAIKLVNVLVLTVFKLPTMNVDINNELTVRAIGLNMIEGVVTAGILYVMAARLPYRPLVRFLAILVPFFWIEFGSNIIQWIPTFNPALQKHHQGLNMWGTTIIEQAGGELVHQVFSAWARLFALGPEQLQLTGLFTWQLSDDESDPYVSNDTRKDEDKLVTMKHDTEEDEIQVVALGTTGNYTQTTATGSYAQLKLDRDSFVQQLTTLAQFGKQAATGEFFIIHLGI